jgi:hypothetical protein
MTDQSYELKLIHGGIAVAFDSGVLIQLQAGKDTEGRWQVHPPHGVTIHPRVWKEVARRALGRFVATYHAEDR